MNLFSAVIMLILIMNPLGLIPFFLSTLKPIDPKRHNYIIVREVFFACVILVVFMYFGQYFLKGLRISEQALGISGSIILFLIALRMIFPAEKQRVKKEVVGEPFVVPLAIPMIAGPGALTTVMLFSSKYTEDKLLWILAIVLSSVIFCVVILGARYLSKIFSDRGLSALEKLSGMMLTAMAVQMLLTGISSYFKI